MNVLGIDIGSLTAKSAIINSEHEILAHTIIPTGANSRKACNASLERTLEEAGLERVDLGLIVSTGYGREAVEFADAQVTEITCHARGAHFFHPQTRAIIDVGGQDSKAIKINEHGKVMKFAMNDKCAAGTGRFLEVMARSLEVTLGEMGPLSLQSQAVVSISSMCTVFAESEVVSLIAEGCEVHDIIRGLHLAIADRILSLLDRVGVNGQVTMTGGVAKNIGVVKALEDKLGLELVIPQEPQIAGALGAALIALDRVS